jgi:hypothetical protein
MARLPKNPRPQVAVFIPGQASVPAETVVNRPPLPASRAVATPTCGEVNEGPAKLRAANERAPIPGPPTGATPKERALTLAPPKRAIPKGTRSAETPHTKGATSNTRTAETGYTKGASTTEAQSSAAGGKAQSPTHASRKSAVPPKAPTTPPKASSVPCAACAASPRIGFDCEKGHDKEQHCGHAKDDRQHGRHITAALGAPRRHAGLRFGVPP